MSELGGNGNAPVRVVQAGDPVAEAARLAAELEADVALDAESAEAAVRDRAEAARRVREEPPADPDVLARADEIRAAAAAAPPLTDDDVEELRTLADDLGRAARIRERTEAKVSEVLEARVASSSGVALHPQALASAAEAVRTAEQALADAERSLLEHGSPPTDDPGAAEAASAAAVAAAETETTVLTPHDDFDEARLIRRRFLRNTLALVAAVAALAVVGIAIGGPPIVIGAVAAVAVAVGVLLLRRRGEEDTGEADAAETLALVADLVASTESGRRAAELGGFGEPEPAPEPVPEPEPAPAEPPRSAAFDEWMDWRARLEAARDEAEELVRVARNRWHQLAGPDADPHRPDDVIRAHDAQLAYGPRVLAASPSVRTVTAFHRRTQARWRVLWASFGYDEAPDPDDLDGLLDRVLADHRAAREELARLEAAEARVEAERLVRRPLVLVQPRDWVAPGRLAELLSSLPPDGEVVIVEQQPEGIAN